MEWWRSFVTRNYGLPDFSYRVAAEVSRREAELRKSLELTEASCRELGRDRERLDRFERARWMFKVTARGNAVTVAHGGTREQGYHPSLRAAIDAARATEAEDD